MLTLEEARARILAEVAPVTGEETVDLAEALGRILSVTVRSPVDIPTRPCSAMDGYAVAGSELASADSTSFEVAGVSAAGHPYAGKVGPGQCVRIMTGATLPDGTDSVVMQEHVRLDGDNVVVGAGHRAGQHVRPAGEDMRRGDLVLEPGTQLGPAQIGVLATLGVARITVRRRPRVAIFSTGDELQPLGEVLAPGQIYDSNRYTLRAMLAHLPVDVLDFGLVRDTREDTRHAFETAAATSDALITSGGVSVGDADYVAETLERHGKVVFWKVAVKPGKPMAFGRVGAACFFGLPGNPVSAMVTYCQLVQPALYALAGAAHARPAILLRATCTTPLRKHPGRLEFQRGVLEQQPGGAYSVRSSGHQGSAALHSMSEANCFIVLPLDQGDVQPGSEVLVQPFATLF